MTNGALRLLVTDNRQPGEQTEPRSPRTVWPSALSASAVSARSPAGRAGVPPSSGSCPHIAAATIRSLPPRTAEPRFRDANRVSRRQPDRSLPAKTTAAQTTSHTSHYPHTGHYRTGDETTRPHGPLPAHGATNCDGPPPARGTTPRTQDTTRTCDRTRTGRRSQVPPPAGPPPAGATTRSGHTPGTRECSAGPARAMNPSDRPGACHPAVPPRLAAPDGLPQDRVTPRAAALPQPPASRYRTAALDHALVH